MKKVLIITHVEAEGPGTLGDFLQSFEDLKIQRAKLYNGEKLPYAARNLDAIVTMGGPMNVHDEDEYPFLKEETEVLKQAIDANTPILGICLGAQMIARACLAPVNKALEKELGWKNVSLTDSSRRGILFQGIADKMRVFQWHEDTFEIPYGGSLLATSGECSNQAFRYGNAYGLQFHVEVTRDMLSE
ncbi:MAG: type 1 glutamine amidotransferase [Syntrophobacterales bacterium]|nr:type 1 glutamine amidotransferase [Syntrophobacterales bacterium]